MLAPKADVVFFITKFGSFYNNSRFHHPQKKFENKHNGLLDIFLSKFTSLKSCNYY
jgi:hypothetical protein